ncbi:MAG: carbohydrate porin [Endomicrobium sp.]|nr:carbohydrate porin [Endomicrobium sp.]
MNKKIRVIFIATLFAVVCANKVILASDDLTEKLKTNISARSTFILQAIKKTNNTYNEIYDTHTMGLDVSKEFKDNSKITVSLKGGLSNYTVDTRHPTYATINKSANSKDLYTEVVYHKPLFCNKLDIDFGKFGLGKYFDKNVYADDTSTQFLTGSFVSNRTIESLGDRLGLRLNYAFDKFDIGYGYFSLVNNRPDRNGFNILQINYKPSKKGNYRLYGWIDNRGGWYYSVVRKEGEFKRKSGISGIGVSLDREMSKQIGLFARFGYKDPSIRVIVGDNGIISENADIPLLLWNIGTQIKGSLLCCSRINDIIGLAVGQIYGCKCNKNPETQIELYYKLAISDNLAITPVLQYIVNSKGRNKNNVFIYGIRTYFKF